MKTGIGIDQAGLYESLDEEVLRRWYDELVEQYPGHPLLAQLNKLVQRHIHLQKFADKLTKWSDRQTLKVIESNRKLAETSITDPLTTLLNRRGMYRHLENASRQLIAEGTAFGLLLLDLDHFKRINDQFGHQAGDETLIAVASTMGNSVVKDQAMLSRWGGEEFLVLVKIADPNTLTEVANKLLSAIRGISITNEQGTIHPTASIGAYYCDHPESVEGSVDKADLAMYHAKNGGRNRIEMFGDLKSEVGP